MPVQGLSHLTHSDALAITAYLKSLPAAGHNVPGPFGPAEKPDTFALTILSADVYLGLPQPPAT